MVRIIQSENGINSGEELTAIQDEINQLTTELDRVANTTEFSGIELLNGDYAEGVDSLDFLVGARGTENEVISINVGNMSASSLGTLGDDAPDSLDGVETGVAGVNVNNDDQSVEQQLEMIDAAIADVGSQRAELGAIQNRFQSTIANLTNVSENVSGARSRIMDTDFAAETAKLTQFQITQQASTSILAQANQRPQAALSLL